MNEVRYVHIGRDAIRSLDDGAVHTHHLMAYVDGGEDPATCPHCPRPVSDAELAAMEPDEQLPAGLRRDAFGQLHPWPTPADVALDDDEERLAEYSRLVEAARAYRAEQEPQ